LNYYPFHLGDYAAHTAHLSPIEDLAYRRMLDLYYLKESPLPCDWREIARVIRLRDNGAEIEAVLAEFFTLSDFGWSHARCDAEIVKMKDKQTKAKASAEASVSARRAKAEHASSASAERTLNERSTNAELPTPTPTPTPRANAVDAPQSAASKRGSRLDQDWRLPKPWGEWALSEFKTWTDETVRIEAEKFRDFWHAKAGKEASKLDWLATWRNWCRNAKPSNGFNGGGGKYDGAAAAIYGD